MEKQGISCIAVGDMLKKRLEEYTEALSSGADKATLASMEDDIDKIEAVHDKCVAAGDVTDIGTSRTVDSSSIVVDEAEGEDGVETYTNYGDINVEEEEGN